MVGEEQLSFSSKSRKIAGEIIESDSVTGGEIRYATAQCSHCGLHWQVIPGSGKRRGFCFKCLGMLCGQEACIKECVPFEAQIEIMEKNKQTIEKYRGNDLTFEKLGVSI